MGREPLPGRAVRLDRTALRNGAIIAALAAVVLVWQEGFGSAADVVGNLLSILLVVAISVWAISYFRQNRLAWLVLKRWQRAAIIGCGVAIGLLIIGGFPLLSSHITPLGVMALIAALVLVIVWIVRESRSLR